MVLISWPWTIVIGIPNFSQNCTPLLLILNLFYVFKHIKKVCRVLCRNVTADGPAAAAEVRAVPDIGAPHRGVADCSETGRRDLAAALRDQPDSRSVPQSTTGLSRIIHSLVTLQLKTVFLTSSSILCIKIFNASILSTVSLKRNF